ncbi:MAG: leucine-rich repeat domain-containing protein [Calditrichaeota bacterium]|nr:MAG: leucine-rich repeat domain-containing protein [Calditrichota bacterium]NOG45110.1 hypothetical protein [Calditrichota bacterium]
MKVLPPDIKKLSHLELIDLRGNPLKDIPEIKGLFVDFHVFKKCEIKKENIYGLKLKKEDKADLKNFTNLQSLYLSYNKISDISFLKGLSNLQSLDLSSNKISDYSFLKGLSNLQSLYLSYNKISDISFLKGLSNLQSLYLSSNKISDISFLKGLSPAIARFREK